MAINPSYIANPSKKWQKVDDYSSTVRSSDGVQIDPPGTFDPSYSASNGFNLPSMIDEPYDPGRVAAMSGMHKFSLRRLEEYEKNFQSQSSVKQLFGAIQKGVGLKDTFKKTEEVMLANERDAIQQKIETAYENRGKIEPMQADRTDYNSAMSSYRDLASAAPSAPQRNVRDVTPQEQLIAAIAQIMGVAPQGQAGVNLALSPEMAAQQQADTNYANDTAQYNADSSNWENQMKAAGIGVNSERDLLMDRQNTLDNQHLSSIRSSDAEIRRLEIAMEKATDNERMALNNAVNDWKDTLNEAWKDGELTEDERSELIALREPFLRNYRLGKDFAYSLPIPDAGFTAQRINQDENRNLKIEQFRQLVFNQDQKIALSKLNMAQRSRMFYDKLKSVEGMFNRTFGLKQDSLEWKKFVDSARIDLAEQGLDISEFNAQTGAFNADTSRAKVFADLREEKRKKVEQAANEKDPVKKKTLENEAQDIQLKINDATKQLRVRPEGNEASVRTSNPGAMHLGKIAKKWGAMGKEELKDGTGQKNNAAVFPDALSGFAAQFDLLKSSYLGKSLRQAIQEWSGGNNVNDYLEHIRRETGFNERTFLSREFLASENGFRLVKAMAKHEAGRQYPVDDDVIRTAQVMVMSGKPGGMPAPTIGQQRTAQARGGSPRGQGTAAPKVRDNPPSPTGKGKTPATGTVAGSSVPFRRVN